MDDLVAAFGLMLVLEGIPYFVAPERMRHLLSRVMEAPDAVLRRSSVMLMLLGLLLVYSVRG
ncbi:MAG: DUF2065 domain-containing protein [Magnetococcales bacterium]|nr:DUF2065 domain-containing protein [Magnetococcales bacterium]